MPGAAFIAARRRRSKKSGKNESVYSRNASSSSPDAVAGAAGICTLSFLRAVRPRVQLRSMKSAKVPKSLHSVLGAELFAQGMCSHSHTTRHTPPCDRSDTDA